MNVTVRIAKEFEQTTKKIGEIRDKFQIRYRVEQGDPTDKERSCEWINNVDSFFEQWKETGQGECSGGINRLIWRLLISLYRWRFRAVENRDVGSSRLGDNVLYQTI